MDSFQNFRIFPTRNIHIVFCTGKNRTTEKETLSSESVRTSEESKGENHHEEQ